MARSTGHNKALRPRDILLLATWCRENGLRWGAVASLEPALLLEQAHPSRAFQRMVLRLENDALRLHDETGALLAEASDLPALLDAVDGGVGETAAPVFARSSSALCVGVAVNVVL